jgi:hypothetical protein
MPETEIKKARKRQKMSKNLNPPVRKPMPEPSININVARNTFGKKISSMFAAKISKTLIENQDPKPQSPALRPDNDQAENDNLIYLEKDERQLGLLEKYEVEAQEQGQYELGTNRNPDGPIFETKLNIVGPILEKAEPLIDQGSSEGRESPEGKKRK